MSAAADWSQDRINAASKTVLKRAASDPEFRKLCRRDSRAAIKEALGVELPPTFPNIHIVEPEDVVFVMPPLSSASELSDEDLELVAGGAFGPSDDAGKIKLGLPGTRVEPPPPIGKVGLG